MSRASSPARWAPRPPACSIDASDMGSPCGSACHMYMQLSLRPPSGRPSQHLSDIAYGSMHWLQISQSILSGNVLYTTRTVVAAGAVLTSADLPDLIGSRFPLASAHRLCCTVVLHAAPSGALACRISWATGWTTQWTEPGSGRAFCPLPSPGPASVTWEAHRTEPQFRRPLSDIHLILLRLLTDTV